MSATVQAVTAAAFTIPTDAPEADGTFAWDHTTLVIVQATAGDQVGTGWTYGPSACAVLARDLLAPVVVGRVADDVPAAAAAMAAAVRNAGRPGAVGYALSAVDVALWDLKARLLGVPLFRLLGAARDQVPIYGSGGFTSYPDQVMVDQLLGWVRDDGVNAVKIKIGQDWGGSVGRDLDRAGLARRTVGTDVDLFVDANGAYQRKAAVRVGRELDQLQVVWFEEPVSSDDLAGLREVRDNVAADVAAGEYGYDLAYFHRMCAAQAVDCLQVDASRCGGVSEWLRAAAVAASHGLQVSGHCAPALHVHAAMAVPNLRHLEWFHDHVRIEAMAFDGVLAPSGGALRPDASAPGHGLTVRWPDLQEYRVG